MKSMSISDSRRLQMLEWREGILDTVLDTDTATEVDDPFAVSYLLLSPERFRVKAIYAAPFAMNERTQDPAAGMEMSYQEILRIMKLCGKQGCCEVKRGSCSYLPGKDIPVESKAALDLAERAMCYSSDNPLYVIGIGAGTNIASALLLNPEIRERIVIVWLAGNDFTESPNTYNVYQDVKAAQVIFDSGVPLLYVPCNYVTSHMLTSVPELESCLGNRNDLCDYLISIVKAYGKEHFAWGKTIWDIGAVGCLMDKDWSIREITTAPIITDELTWSRDYTRHLIGNIKEVNRDRIFRDAFLKMGCLEDRGK